MFARRMQGFTLMELVVVLSILAILLALAVPRYLAQQKKAYRAEAADMLQEVKTLEWVYYQQYDAFDLTGSSIGLVAPGGMHWAPVSFGGASNSGVSMLMSGCGAGCSPIGTTDSVWITLGTDGSSSRGWSF